MGFLKSKKSGDQDDKQKPSDGTFFSNASSSGAATSKVQHSKVETSEHAFGDPTMRVDASLELQTDLRSAPSSRDYLQQSLNDSAANNEQPTSRAKIAHGRKTKAEMLVGDNRMLFSTHRAALIDPQQVEVERAAKKDAQENRAWRSLTAMLELFAR